MKYAVAAKEPNVTGPVASVFGRCPWLLVFDDATGAIEVVENTAATQSGGAGVKAAQLVLDHGVDVLVAPKVGPKAHDVLTEGGVRFVFRSSGTAEEALQSAREEMLD